MNEAQRIQEFLNDETWKKEYREASMRAAFRAMGDDEATIDKHMATLLAAGDDE